MDEAGNSGESAPVRKKVPGRPFPKGVSGNPRGRPKTSEEFRKACAERTEKALLALDAEIENEGRDKFKALELLIAYAHGKPTQAVEHSGKDGGELKVIVQTLPPEAD